jgi:hypothetical protein
MLSLSKHHAQSVVLAPFDKLTVTGVVLFAEA